MNEINNFSEALQLLKQQEIIYTISNSSITYFYLQQNNINIKAISFHSKINLNDFIKLYNKEQFYLYIPKDDRIDNEKDTQYYSWKSKNAN